MITNGEITAMQKKAYNVILHQAQQELRVNEGETSFLFSIKELKEKAGIKAENNVELKEGIFSLVGIRVETMKENTNDWGVFTLISDAKKNGDLLEIELPKTIREALIENSYYTTLDLLTLKTLSGKYAIILYEMALRYKNAKIPKLSIDEFKELTGTTNINSYKDFSLLRRKVIEPALEEINAKTDIILTYETEKKGRTNTHLIFLIQKKSQPKLVNYFPEVEELYDLVKTKTEKVRDLIQKHLKEDNFDIIKSNIIYSNKNSKDNYYKYLEKAIIEDYAEQQRIEKNNKYIKMEQQIKAQEPKVSIEERNEIGLKKIEEIKRELENLRN